MIKIALAQINSFLGDINSNEKKILQYITQAKKEKADLIIFPEMALSGYLPEDLLYKKFFLKKVSLSLKNIHKKIPENIRVLIGSLSGEDEFLKNSCFYLKKDEKPQVFSKEYLPDYDVFDEKRYFKKGLIKDNVFKARGFLIQVLICEDTWQKPLAKDTLSALTVKKKDLIISINASPFEINKNELRLKMAKLWAKKQKSHFIYLNAVGGQEELIFDGGSFVLDKKGELLKQSPFFKEDLSFFVLPSPKKENVYQNKLLFKNKAIRKKPSKQKKIAGALSFGIKEFAEKNNFKKAHLGLSGGVDSALTALLASLALGEKNVKLFFLPGPFTSALSEKCVQRFLKKFNFSLSTHSINNDYFNILKNFSLKNLNLKSDIVKQNIQARLRSLFLMAYANKEPKSLLLGTSNKSELSLGYGTLYGDLTGALLPIGDLFKTEIFKLANYFQVPRAILNRKASAELKKNQKDEDDIPPYKILDPILLKIIEENQEPKGALEKKIFKDILKSEFKRRQSPPVLKIKNRSFGKGWRIPLSLYPDF